MPLILYLFYKVTYDPLKELFSFLAKRLVRLEQLNEYEPLKELFSFPG